jgi:hypothetical protein
MGRAPSRLAQWLPSLGDVAFLLPVLFLFGRLDGARTLLTDGDTGWHIRAGDWMLQHGRVPRHDFFSFTLPGRPWFAWEWLSELGMAWLHRWGGMAAVVLAATLVLSVTFWLLYKVVLARCGNPLVAIGLTVVAVAGSSLHWLARPHLASLLLIVVFLGILESRRRGLLWLLPLLTGLWVNLHAGFVFGVLLVLVYGEWIVAAATVAASLANPYGWHLHAHIARYLAADSWQFAHINEFCSPNFQAPLARYFEGMLALGLAAAFWHLLRRRWGYALLLAGAGHMALVSARHIPIFLLAAVPAVAVAVVEWLDAARRAALPTWAHRILNAFRHLAANAAAMEKLVRVPAASLLACLWLSAALLAPAAAGKFRSGFDPRTFPVRAAETLRGRNARIFTSDQWGDYLIYRLYPDIRVFVDGRSDFYGSDLEQASLDVWNVRYDWQHQLGRWGIDTVLAPADTPLAGALKESGRWRVVYDDGTAIVFCAAAEKVSGGNLAQGRPPEEPQFLRSELK